MQVIMFDRQSIFIHGMNVSLQESIPEWMFRVSVRQMTFGKSWKQARMR